MTEIDPTEIDPTEAAALSDVCKRAIKIIEKYGWRPGPHLPHFDDEKICMGEALIAANQQLGGRYPYWKDLADSLVATEASGSLAFWRGIAPWRGIAAWNDAPERTEEEVIEYLRSKIV